VAFTLASVGLIVSRGNNRKDAVPVAVVETNDNTAAVLGESIDLSNTNMDLLKIDRTTVTSVGEMNKISIKLSIFNTSEATMQFSPGIHTFLVSSDELTMYQFSLEQGDLTGGPILAMKSVHGTISFFVPNTVQLSTLYLAYQDPLSLNTYTYRLQ
jgi:hypothetical protein